MSRPRVQLTRRWPAAVEAALAQRYELRTNPEDRPLERTQLIEALHWADALCPTVTDDLGPELFAQVSAAQLRVRLLGNYGVGYNHIDLSAAQARSLTVTNTPGVLTEATAELALTLLLMVARRAGEGERQVRAGRWRGWGPTHLVGTQVSGKTLGIVGMGRIGQALARKAQHGLDMRIVYFSRSALSATAAFEAERCATLSALLAQSDFISLHCPSTPETRGLIDAKQLQHCQTGAYLINTARGDIVDETALAQALAAGQLAGAGLDVYAKEPQVPQALRERDDVVLLPHLGSATSSAREAMGYRVMSNLDAFFAGQIPPDAL